MPALRGQGPGDREFPVLLGQVCRRPARDVRWREPRVRLRDDQVRGDAAVGGRGARLGHAQENISVFTKDPYLETLISTKDPYKNQRFYEGSLF